MRILRQNVAREADNNLPTKAAGSQPVGVFSERKYTMSTTSLTNGLGQGTAAKVAHYLDLWKGLGRDEMEDVFSQLTGDDHTDVVQRFDKLCEEGSWDPEDIFRHLINTDDEGLFDAIDELNGELPYGAKEEALESLRQISLFIGAGSLAFDMAAVFGDDDDGSCVDELQDLISKWERKVESYER
jgi:hypothetical protein